MILLPAPGSVSSHIQAGADEAARVLRSTVIHKKTINPFSRTAQMSEFPYFDPCCEQK